MLPRLLNLALRGGGMGGKFLLIFLLARILAPQELGTFGLIAATVSYSLYFLGLDFYTYSGRAMLSVERTMWPGMLRNQAALFGCSYLIVFPLVGLVFVTGVLPAQYAPVFYVLLITEHLSQELIRLLVVVGKPLAAGVAIFVRYGAWCYVLVAVSLGGVALNLATVLWTWAVAGTVTLAGGIWLLRKLPWSAMAPGIDWAWIGRGLRVAALFLVGTLALRAPFTMDRYLIEAFESRELLGVYTLYAGICTILIAFVDAAVFSFGYPRLVYLYRSGNREAFAAARADFRRQTLLATGILVTAAALLVAPVLEWTGRPIYLQHLPVFYVLLTAAAVFVIGHIPHYSLYAMGEDRSIVATQVAGLVIFAVLGLALTRLYGLAGVATALLVAMLCIGALKQWRSLSADRLLTREA